MEIEDRTLSMGACDREFEEIQNALRGMSKDIDHQLSSPGISEAKNNNFEMTEKSFKQAERDYELDTLLTWSNEDFDEKISKMKTVDLDMAIIILEQQIQIESKLSLENENGMAKLSQLRERLTKCFTTKTDLSRHKSDSQGSRNIFSESSSSKSSNSSDADVEANNTATDDINYLSFAELQALLFYNGVTYDENARKETLVDLVKTEILEDGEAEVWEPPKDSEIQWKSPISEGESKIPKMIDDSEKYQTSSATSSSDPENFTESAEDTLDGGLKVATEVMPRKQDSNQDEKESSVSPSEPEHRNASDEAVLQLEDSQLATDMLPSEDGKFVEWNPTTLLKDLYMVLKRPEPINFNKEAVDKTEEPVKPKLEGYLDKLPVNQTKATLLKGWKKRHFRILLGKIHYYEDHIKSEPLGSLLLTGSGLKVVGDKVIQITAQNTRNVLTIRCSSVTETNDWYRTIKRESAITAPVTLPVKAPMFLENPTSNVVIIDLGASTIRGGFAGEEKPRVVFPAVYAVQRDHKRGRKFTESGLPDPSLCTCGFDAFKPEIRRTSKLVFPLRPTLKVDKFAIKSRYIPGFIDKVFNELNSEPQSCTVIVSCQRHFSDKDKEIVFDHLFGHLGVTAVYAQQQALLSLYSYKDTTGIIVDVGDHIDVFPVVEDVIIENGSSSIPHGGQLVSENLARFISEGGYRFFSEVESLIVRYLKEKTAFVSLDYEKELGLQQKIHDVDVGKYNLPGKQSSISLSTERFRCAEGLFDPSKWGKDNEGLHKLVEKAIKQSGIDQRKEMCRKIFLSGGTTLIEGFKERLQKELKLLMPETINIMVHAAENRANAAFLGATVISEQPTFSRNLITKEDWHDYGSDVFKKMALS